MSAAIIQRDTTLKKTQQDFNIIDSIRDYFKLRPFMPIIPWAESTISYAEDVSSERDHTDFSKYPYQIEVLRQWEDLNVRKHVTLVSCEQMRQDEHSYIADFFGGWCMTHAPLSSSIHLTANALKLI